MMVVEDEGLIRDMLAQEFADAGFEVFEAGSGDEAVALLSAGVVVGVVLTDVRMPGRLDGLGLVAWLRDNRPGLPIVVTSGYVTPAQVGAINTAIAAVIGKPYAPADVVALVAETLLGHPSIDS